MQTTEIIHDLEIRLKQIWPDSMWEKILLQKLRQDRAANNYKHISYNIIHNISLYLELAKRGLEEPAKIAKESEKYFRLHNTYITLLLEHPDYCRDEFASIDGHFSDVPNTGDTAIQDYISKSKKRLNAKTIK